MSQRKNKIIVVGSGGAVGSVLAPALARNPLTGELRLVDHDSYEDRNIESQQIRPSDVGLPKVAAGARGIRETFPDFDVLPLHAPVETLPLGVLHGDLIVVAVDTRAARQYVNQAAWNLGVPWVDIGIDSWALQARVAVFVPGRDAACVECAWTNADYDAVEQSNSCTGPAAAPATNAPFALAGFAASLAGVECSRVLENDYDGPMASCEIFHDLRARVQSVTKMVRTPHCRFDHAVWNIRTAANVHLQMSMNDFVDAAAEVLGGAVSSLKIEGAGFATSFFCAGCREFVQTPPRAAFVAGAGGGACRHCGGPLAASGFDANDRIGWQQIALADRARTLAEWGFRPGEVIAAATDGAKTVHIKLPFPSSDPVPREERTVGTSRGA